GLVLLLYIGASKAWLRLDTKTWLLLIGAAVFFALDLWFWHRSILLVGPGLSTLLANLQVFFMIAAGVLLLGERPTRLQLLAAALSIVGLSIMLGPNWLAVVPGFRTGVVFGLLTAMSSAGYLLCMRRARRDAQRRVPAFEVATVSLLVAGLLGIAIAVEGNSFAIPTAADFGWLAAYGILSHVLGWMLIASSLPQVSATQIGIALLLQPALSMLWDVLLFGRPITALELAGAALTLTAIFLGARRTVAGR
ncbi:MAG: DMT family transporter, partial [Gammaproteobacteria bacterium]|nr:DMT family transporter [Gammaproteobacteria bacterium]